ncbi:MAG: HNH endonuclease [Armatimonadetes bacterium]|nr:HNH endonuclease [Armatimonadota bacterium]
MQHLRIDFRRIQSDSELSSWGTQFGWALVPANIAKRGLAPLLGAKACVRSATGLFWDVALPRNRAASRRTSHLRDQVLKRDGHACIQCQRSEGGGVDLTLDHVIPFSRGGETTPGNLVTLCTQCNQAYGDRHHPHLFILAGLDHDWDPKLLDAALATDADAMAYAMMLSQNLMVSRCSRAGLPLALSRDSSGNPLGRNEQWPR